MLETFMPLRSKKFYMMRHGESLSNSQGLIAGGDYDSPLTDEGRAQAARVMPIIDTLDIDCLCVSSLSRAQETAMIVNRRRQLPFHTFTDLVEQRVGDWDGKRWQDIMPLFHGNVDPPNGETHPQFESRVHNVLHACIAKGTCPLIVCHGGVIHAAIKYYGYNFDHVSNCDLYAFVPHQGDGLHWNVTQLTWNDDTGMTVCKTPSYRRIA